MLHSSPDKWTVSINYPLLLLSSPSSSFLLSYALFVFASLSKVPNPREKSILLVKMMTYIEKRFPDDLELNGQFLDLVNYVYR